MQAARAAVASHAGRAGSEKARLDRRLSEQDVPLRRRGFGVMDEPPRG